MTQQEEHVLAEEERHSLFFTFLESIRDDSPGFERKEDMMG